MPHLDLENQALFFNDNGNEKHPNWSKDRNSVSGKKLCMDPVAAADGSNFFPSKEFLCVVEPDESCDKCGDLSDPENLPARWSQSQIYSFADRRLEDNWKYMWHWTNETGHSKFAAYQISNQN